MTTILCSRPGGARLSIPAMTTAAFQQLSCPARAYDGFDCTTLRHTAASLLLAQGVAARVVMEILGHSQISITMNTYTHVDSRAQPEATDRIERLLWPDEDHDGRTNG